MAIDFTCQCGKKYHIADQHAGKPAKCVACGRIVRVPFPEKQAGVPSTGQPVGGADIAPRREKEALPQVTTSAPKKATLPLLLADPQHPSRQWIDKAARAADTAMTVSVGVFQTNTVDAQHVIADIDKALEVSPDDPDLLVAKSGALCCALQFKTAEEFIDRVLSIDATHFEARQRKDHWEKWPHLFQYPAWSQSHTALHPVMADRLRLQDALQIVRDGLQIGIAVVKPVPISQFPRGLTSSMRSAWEPLLSETPFGPIFAHYLIIEDDPADPFKGEAFLSTFVPTEMSASSGYWLIQRMKALSSCFLVIVDGPRVLYNRRCVFPDSLRSKLAAIARTTAERRAKVDLAAFTNACQWHMQHFDMRNIRS